MFWGGLPTDFEIRKEKLVNDNSYSIPRTSFLGCIRDAQILTEVSPTDKWTPVNWSLADTPSNLFSTWEGCPVDLQDGIHFLGRGLHFLCGIRIWEVYRLKLLISPQALRVIPKQFCLASNSPPCPLTFAPTWRTA